MLSGPSFVPPVVKKVVILCHGYGADGEDLMGIVPYLAQSMPDTAFFAPNGIKQMPYGGYEWFSLDDYSPADMISIDYLDKLVGRCKEPAEEIRTLIGQVQAKYSLTDGDIVLAGFSQGALLALYTALTHPYPLAGVVGFSSVPIVFAGSLHADAIKRHIPILLTHGTADEVIPAEAMELSMGELQKVGQSPKSFLASGLGHGINEACLDQMIYFIDGLFPSK